MGDGFTATRTRVSEWTFAATAQPVQAEDTQLRHPAFNRFVGSVITPKPLFESWDETNPEPAGPNVIFFIHL